MYTSHFPMTTAKRLKTIELLANGVRHRVYSFAYWSDGTTARSLLVSAQQYGKDATLDASGIVTGGTSLPPIQLRYGQDIVGLSSPAQWIQYGGTFQAGKAQYADVNADGNADLIYQESDNQFWVSLSTGTGFTAPTVWVDHGNFFELGQAQYADLNGDGKADLVFQATDNKFWVSLSTSTGFIPPAMWLQHGGTFQAGMMRYVDLNGDGRADLIMQGTDNKFWVSLSIVQDTVPNTVPNLLHTINTGLGGATTVAYTPSPNGQISCSPFPCRP